MNIYKRNLPVCNSGLHTYVTSLFNFAFVLQDLIDRIDSISREQFLRGTCFLLASNTLCHKFFRCKYAAFTGMALRKLERRNYGESCR